MDQTIGYEGISQIAQALPLPAPLAILIKPLSPQLVPQAYFNFQ